MSNCPCVPCGKACMFEKHAKDLIGCFCRILNYRLRELEMELPIIGDWFEPYVCDLFIDEIDCEE